MPSVIFLTAGVLCTHNTAVCEIAPVPGKQGTACAQLCHVEHTGNTDPCRVLLSLRRVVLKEAQVSNRTGSVFRGVAGQKWRVR